MGVGILFSWPFFRSAWNLKQAHILWQLKIPEFTDTCTCESRAVATQVTSCEESLVELGCKKKRKKEKTLTL